MAAALLRIQSPSRWLFLIWERIGIARNVGHGVQDNNFTVRGANQLGADIGMGDLVRLCLVQNDGRLGRYDRRLLRPSIVPALARFVLCFMGSGQKGKK